MEHKSQTSEPWLTDTPRIGKVNTPCINTYGIVALMDQKTLKASRLRQARKAAGYANPAKAAEAFGWREAGYRHHENETREFGADAAAKYGRAFKVRAGWLMALDGVDRAPEERLDVSPALVINGSVEAGAWREGREWNDARAFQIVERPFPVANRLRYGLEVSGESMNEFYADGTVLDCISVFAGSLKPRNGDHVIVQALRPDGLRELTVKEFQRDGDRYYAVPRSTDPRFTDRIEIGFPDSEHPDPDETSVIGFVVGHVTPRELELLRRMGLIQSVEKNDT